MMNQHSLKLWIYLACVTTSMAAPAQYQYQPIQMDIIDLAAISRMSPQQLESLAEGLALQEMMRTKRSSAQALTAVASKASSASSLGQKVGLLGQASAGAVSLISSASSKSGHEDVGYSYEPHESKIDYWGLKKSILYTLFQAVKAITGGVTILKGQLIRGGGALAATLGKVISVKGEAVSNLGKKIVSSAALSHKKPHSTAVYGPPPPPAHVDYPPSAYGAPTAPASYSHIAPSASGFSSHKYPAHLDEMIAVSSVVDDEAEYTYHRPPPEPSYQLYEAYYNLVDAVLWNQRRNSEPDHTTKFSQHRYFLSSHTHHLTLDTDVTMTTVSETGRGKLNGVHAGLVILTPIAEETSSHIHQEPPTGLEHDGHTPLEPPQSILHTAFSAIQNVFSSAVPSLAYPTTHNDLQDHPPPPPQPVPPFKPMWGGAVNSYGEPATPDSYSDYPPQHSFDYASSKKSSVPKIPPSASISHGLTSEKLQKISANLDKLAHLKLMQRSSEELPHFNLDVYRQMLEKGAKVPFLPTPVVTDAEIGVLPADYLPSESPSTSLTTSTTSTTTTTTTTQPPTDEKTRRRKDAKYLLRGNKIVIV